MKFFVVDAFTSKLFSGNPAAVFILEEPISDQLMQQIASEINLSETAFVVKKGSSFDLRWFTPTKEVDLCGHATLASSHILWEQKILSESEIAEFSTRSGVLTAKKSSDFISMDFPSDEVKNIDSIDIFKELNLEPTFIGRTSFDYFLEVSTPELVMNYNPMFEIISKLDSRGLIVTSKSNSDSYDFVSRFFAPQSGVPEDPVTGSAHCSLGTYWYKKLGKSDLIGYQASVRGGIVKVKVEENRVILSGSAVTVIKSELLT